MSRQSDSGRRTREMRKYRRNEILILFLIIAVLAVFFLIIYLGKLKTVWDPSTVMQTTEETTEDNVAVWEKNHIEELLNEAERMAQGYDFDGAIEYLRADELYKKTLVLLEKVDEIKERKKDMVAWGDVRNITHISVRALVADTGKAYNSGVSADKYNQNYITVEEFETILQELYDRGYVLVSLHDVASSKNYKESLVKTETTETTAISETVTAAVIGLDIESSAMETLSESTEGEESATEVEIETVVTETTEEDKALLKKGKIMLPEGKTPIVLSEENVCYSPELSGNGFASKLIITKDGNIVCEMADGTTGDYDLVPVLEKFIKEHPDFSYRGARAVLGISGNDGIFGYKTSNIYQNNEGYEAEIEEARRVAEKLRKLGYEFGMNGYHYANLGASAEIETLKNEVSNWLSEVAPIVGDTDIIIFPNGDDIGDWRYYGGERYDYLSSKGFVYYLNMNSSERAWNQILNYYMRQGRRMITAKLIAKEINGAENFTDLFDPYKVFDKRHLPIE